jgi:hypothetical protein
MLVEMVYVTCVRMAKCPTATNQMAIYQQAIHIFASPVRLASLPMHGAAGDASCAAMASNQLTTTRGASSVHLEKQALVVSATTVAAGQKRTPTAQPACLVHRDKLALMDSAIPVQTDTGQMLYYPHASSAPAAGPALTDFAQVVVMAKNPVATAPTVGTARTTWSARVMNAKCAKLGSLWMSCNIGAKAVQLDGTVTRSSFMETALANASTLATAHSNRKTTGQQCVRTIALASTRAYFVSSVHPAMSQKEISVPQAASLAESLGPASILQMDLIVSVARRDSSQMKSARIVYHAPQGGPDPTAFVTNVPLVVSQLGQRAREPLTRCNPHAQVLRTKCLHHAPATLPRSQPRAQVQRF